MKKIKPSTAHPVTRYRNKMPQASKSKSVSTRISVSYSFFAVLLLLVSTLIWAYWGAQLQSSNADQLVNSYLFESAKTFHGALLPGAHSFLIKWPLFLVIKWLGFSPAAFISVTTFLSLVTVGGFAYVLFRVDRRPVVFGTLCLGLASVLALIPAAPYAGALLPVNMAMLATRNIEYLLYIYCLVSLIRARTVKNMNFWISVVCLALLGASDRLFLTLSLGGAILAVVAYFVAKRWVLTKLAARWLIASVLATSIAVGLLWAIDATGITTITGSAGGSPYAYIHNLRSLVLGIVFGSLGILTNFGANPAFDAALLRTIPNLVWSRIWSWGGVGFLTNIAWVVMSVIFSVKVFVSSVRSPAPDEPKLGSGLKLAILLIFSSVAAVGAFIFSDHYYVVDARYLAIIPLTMFICLAAYLSKKQLSSFKPLIIISPLLTISVLMGLYASYGIHTNQKQALAEIKQRNSLVAQAIKSHPVDALLGDYWRTIPIKALRLETHVDPLEDCTHERGVLSSKNWQNDVRSHSFAYLISSDKSLTNFPACNLDQIIAAYGRPNSSVLISGSLEKPTEQVLFYDQGVHKNTEQNNTHTVLPIRPEQIPMPMCTRTIMNIVAHEDDDLLFLSPDLIHDIQEHNCIRTIYVTAGDAGNDQLYWLGRERGSQAAYSKLISSSVPWVERTIKMSQNQFITLANPKGNPMVSLIFLRLADGSPGGQGFHHSQQESLERLEKGKITNMHSVDKQSSYNSEQLTAVLTRLMQIYQPSEIRTQSPSDTNRFFQDHSDHIMVGKYVTKAHKNYDNGANVLLKYYIGYPIKNMPSNVSGTDLDIKTAAFLAYGQFDGATCHSKAQCDEVSNYGLYLSRQYTSEAPE